VLGNNDLVFNIPNANNITFRFVMEEIPGGDLTEDEIKMMEMLENRKVVTSNTWTDKNDFSLNLPESNNNKYSFHLEMCDLDKDSNDESNGQGSLGYGSAAFGKEKKVNATTLLQTLDFGFGDYDIKTMSRFEYEAVLDPTTITITYDFDPKKVTHLDFEAGVLRICGTCGEGIELIDLISSFGKLYHKRCLRCEICHNDFTRLIVKDGEDGKPYCDAHWYDTFSSKCTSCGDPIREDPANALGKTWHPRCFICVVCSEVLDPKAFFSLKGAPYCEYHFYEEQSLICPICELPIKAAEDLLDPRRGQKFHKDHYKCGYCRKALELDQLYKQVDKKTQQSLLRPLLLPSLRHLTSFFLAGNFFIISCFVE